MAERITSSDAAFAALINLIIGSLCVVDRNKADGFQAALAEMRDGFADKGDEKASSIIEYVRRMSDINALVLDERARREAPGQDTQ